MEAALLSGVLKIAGTKLAPLLTSEFSSIAGVKKDLSELERLFGGVTSWLSSVEVGIADNDPSFYWLKELKAVAGDFDDLLAEVHLEAEKRKADINEGKHAMANLFAKTKSVLSQPKMAQEIKKIKKRFAAIVKQRIEINAITNSALTGDPVQHINRTMETSLLMNVHGAKVLGRDGIKHDIVSKLVEVGTRERTSIISIVGLGGSGKTTLSKYICQDNKIRVHFEGVYWVDVSQECDVKKLIGKLFESVSGTKPEPYALQYMSDTISEKLCSKKFLLVLDDVWNKERIIWEQFEGHFNSGAPGSKILLTTRDGTVAEVVNSTDIFNLASLSDDHSWRLCQQSSGWTEEGLDSDFIEVGKEIVKKCAGIPLAIKSLGGVLRGKKQIREWRALRDSNLLNHVDIKDVVSGSLRLSYFHLPDDLKQCLVLCSIFPKGYCIFKDHLISQWIAHGFANRVNAGQLPEDVGSYYFDYLLKVSFLQDLDEDQMTGALRCKMHDLVHDLTREIQHDDIVLTPNITSTDHNQHQRCRYLSLASCTEKIDSKLFNKVRAIYVTGGSCATDKPMKKSCHARSVILEDLMDASIPLFILKFEYLGYLRITGAKCRELPEAITGCWNLQALHIMYCRLFAMLPESIGKLRKLRTLELSCAFDLESLPESIGDCYHLESLKLNTCVKLSKIPDSLRRNENLRVLNIVSCRRLLHLPSEFFGILRNLQTINLNECGSLKDLSSEFPCDELRTLKLNWLFELTMLPQCISSLSNLEHLDLKYCPKLAELPKDIRNLKRLEVLNLEGCSGLRGLPAGFAQLTRLRMLGLFVVGNSAEHAKISELENLDISGTLEIQGIRNVKDPEDAEKACLKKKNNIQSLVLVTSYRWNSSTREEIDMEQELAILSSLEPPPGIKDLRIRDYAGLHFPRWLTRKGEGHACNLDSISKKTVDLPRFSLMTSLKLEYFPKLRHLTGLVELPLLKTLKLERLDALESISAGPFPSLTELVISWMDQLCEWSTMTRITVADEDGVFACGNQGRCCFPRLSTLSIWACPRLSVKPCLPAKLESLTLFRSDEGLLFTGPGISLDPIHPYRDEAEWPSSCSYSYEASTFLSLLKILCLQDMTGASSHSDWEWMNHFPALKSLDIVDCKDLRQLPDSMRTLSTLQQLRISRCSGLCTLPEWFGELRSLQVLKISYCISLRELPEGIQHFTSLQELHIDHCHDLCQLPEVGLGELCSLLSLHIYDLPSLTRLPESMHHLTSLLQLVIIKCDALTSLPESIGELSALQSLTARNCHGLTSLPCSIQRLTALKELCIIGNPHLARHYKQGAGKDWHLISHIPQVEMDNMEG